MSKLKSFHFNVGNSSDGPIGFCARVKAKTKEEATELLCNALEELCDGVMVFSDQDEFTYIDDPPPGVEYLACYFNAAVVDEAHIDEVHEIVEPSE